MNNALVVNNSLSKARLDLDDAAFNLGQVWTAADHDAIGRLTSAIEATVRAVASVSLAVERLAELPVCEGVN